MLEQENVQPHIEIYGGEILNFIFYNYLPHLSSQVEKMGGVFLVKNFVTIFSLIVVLELLFHLLHVRGWVGHFFWSNFLCSQGFVGDIVFLKVSFIFYKFEH